MKLLYLKYALCFFKVPKVYTKPTKDIVLNSFLWFLEYNLRNAFIEKWENEIMNGSGSENVLKGLF